MARASVREDPRDATATPDTAAAPFALVAARFGLVALAGVTAAAYFTWRTGVGNPALPAWSWFVLAVEAAGFLRLLMFIVPTVRMPRTEPPRPVPGLAVDVFVTTCDEEPDVVRRTVMAAVAIRYPHETWLLDDGNRLEMRRLAREAGCRYVARTTHEDAKGGNLNHALTLARGAFVAFFDADHVAAAHFLDRTLGYFRDERTAFVQTPQEFFNFDSYQHLVAGRTESSAESFFNRIVQRSRNASNAVLFCGSCAVMRRAALDEIGGFPTGTVTEGVQASVRLHARGWRAVFHAETLSAGLAAFDAPGFRLQRTRWTHGAVQVLVREDLQRRPGLTFAQRFTYLVPVLGILESWRQALWFLLPAAALLTGLAPFWTDALTFAGFFLPYFFALTLAYNEIARGHGRFIEGEVYKLARCTTAFAALVALRPENLCYRITPKVRGPQTERLGDAFAWLVVLSGAAGIAAAEALAGRSALAAGTATVLVAWTAFNAAAAIRLLLLSRRCRRERRATARLRCSIPAQLAAIDPAGSPAAVEIVAACADGFALRPQPGAPDLAAGRYRGALVIEGTALPFEIELRPPSGERPRGGPVRWDDPAARARFDLALHQLVIGRLATADRGDRGGILGPAVAALDLSAAAGALRRYCTPLAPRARGSVEASGGRPRN